MPALRRNAKRHWLAEVKVWMRLVPKPKVSRPSLCLAACECLGAPQPRVLILALPVPVPVLVQLQPALRLV